MAKLIVTRPRLGQRWDKTPRFEVLVDDKPAAKIGLGETSELEVPPGPHLVRARIGGFGSQPVVVEAGPDETHRLAVGFNASFFKAFKRPLILSVLPVLALFAWSAYDTHQFTTRLRQGGTVTYDIGWRMMIINSTVWIALLPAMAFLYLSSKESLIVLEIPSPDLTAEQVAELLRAHPFRMRITIRHLMIAVALLALAFWGSLEMSRSTSVSSFRSRARLHAESEAIYLKTAQGWINLDLDMEKRGSGKGYFSKAAAKAAAVADYHAAMKRKYEQAAANRSFSVEPDPPQPPWP
jgi:hypothetical protein